MAAEKNSTQEPADFVWSVAPLVPGRHGLDLRANQTVQTPDTLTELVNGRYYSDKGVRRRPGHNGGPVLANSTFFQRNLSETRPWVYGWGDWEPTLLDNSSINYLPQQRQLAGLTTRNGTLVTWTGDRLFEYASSNGGVDGEYWSGASKFWYRFDLNPPAQRGVPGYFPAANISRFDQATAATVTVDRVVGKKYSVVITQGTGSLTAHIQDLATGAWLTRDFNLLGTANHPLYVSCVYSNGRLVVVYSDSTAGNIYVTSADENNPLNWTTPVARGVGQKFDLEQINDSTWLLAWRDTADSKIKATYFRGETPTGAPFPAGTILVNSGAADNTVAVSVARDSSIGLVWNEGNNTKARVFTSVGVALGSAFNLHTAGPSTKLTVAPRWIGDSSALTQFIAYFSVTDGAGASGGQRTKIVQFTYSGASLLETTLRFRSYPASRAFRVGDEVFCWMLAEPTSTTVQRMYYLMGGVFQPRIVGACARGTARVAPDHLQSVRPIPGQGYGNVVTPTTNRWSVAFPENTRSDGTSADIRPLLLELDFMPQLSAAEYGKAVYIAGAAVQMYDGREVVEAGFLQFPEVTSVASSATGGSLTPGDIRAYRVYAVHRNASGEVFRSPAATFVAPAVGGGADTNTITFTTIPATTRQDSWFEVYATKNLGTQFFLLSSALASGAPANAFSVATLSFVDTMSEATLGARPQDPYQPTIGVAANLMTSSPPGCRSLFSARDRIWFIGGDVDRGSVAYTKQRQVLEGAGWNSSYGQLIVDHFGEEITSLGETGDSLVVFLRTRIWAQPGTGPDNTGSGGWPLPTLVASGVGAVNHQGTVQTPKGLAFWSDSGPRLLSGGYSVTDISRQVTPLAVQLTPHVSGAVSVPGADEVRWYTSEGRALLWDHHVNDSAPGGRWAVWDRLPAAGAVYYPVTGAAALALTNGRVLREDVTGTVWMDAGLCYIMTWATAELRPDSLVQGHNRFRRFALRGELYGRHTLGFWTYYDGSPMFRDYTEYNTADNLEDVGWGEGKTTGVWNTDASAWIDPNDYGEVLLDGTYRLRKRLSRQPAATLKLRFTDNGAPNNTALFEELAIEVGQKPGLSRLPSTFTVTPLSPGGGGGLT